MITEYAYIYVIVYVINYKLYETLQYFFDTV